MEVAREDPEEPRRPPHPIMTTDKSLTDRVLGPVSKVSNNLLAAAAASFDEGLGTGLARVRRILHDGEAGPFFRRIFLEWDDLVSRGKAVAERLKAPEVRTAQAEVAHDLEREVPDARRLDLLRRAFLAVAMGSPDDEGGTLGLLYIRSARRLTAEETVVLASAYRRRLEYGAPERGKPHEYEHEWAAKAKVDTGIKFDGPFRRICESLIQQGLFKGASSGISPAWSDKLGMLTDFGLAFCEFLERAQPLQEPASK